MKSKIYQVFILFMTYLSPYWLLFMLAPISSVFLHRILHSGSCSEVYFSSHIRNILCIMDLLFFFQNLCEAVLL